MFYEQHISLPIKTTCAVSCGRKKNNTRLIMNKFIFYTTVNILAVVRKNHQWVFVSRRVRGLSPSRSRVGGGGGLGLVGGAGGRGLVVAAVHLLLHGAVLLQLLAGVVGDLQEAAGLHHHVGLAGVRQDGVLRNQLHVLVTSRFSVTFTIWFYIHRSIDGK